MTKCKYYFLMLSVICISCNGVRKKQESMQRPVEYTLDSAKLWRLQQQFLDLKFGMLICWGSSTYCGQDWADPDLSLNSISPTKLDCTQWAEAAISANMQYGILTTKHHSGFCIWDTKTTDYNIMNTTFKRDVVQEYVKAFRSKGLKTMLYYSVLDVRHNVRPGWINTEKVAFVKKQLTELLTNYGKIDALVFDGWDAWWARIDYEEIPFKDIYYLVKSLQPDCLIVEHNAAKYPYSELFYADIKQYEQNAGEKIGADNRLPAQAGFPINASWFWKSNFPHTSVKSAEYIVHENLMQLNRQCCNLMLGVAPNREGLIDDNVLMELRKIGQIWKSEENLPLCPMLNKRPIISTNLAKFMPMSSSWSFDTRISDFANDDNFKTYWTSYEKSDSVFLEVDLRQEMLVNAIGFVEADSVEFYSNTKESRIKDYQIFYYSHKKWKELDVTEDHSSFVRIHRFPDLFAEKVRYQFNVNKPGLGISEVLIYCE